MLNSKKQSAIAATIILLSVNQAIASSDAPEIQSIADSTNTSGTVAIKPVSAGKTKTSPKHSSIATKVFGVATGVIVGTPICMVRKPMDEDKYAVADLTGNSHKGRAVVPTAALWAPFAAVQGVLEAPFWAVNNSIVNYNKPFSKQQFSLVNSDVSVKKEEEKEKLDPTPYNIR